MKEVLCTALGAAGSVIAGIWGGWDTALSTLIMLLTIDYITGLMVAGFFKKSPKTATGALESHAGWRGLCKKCITLILVLVAHRLDLVIGATYIRDGVCIAFIANEVISIIENAGLMGVPIPAPITRAIEILQNGEDKGNE